jgi:hypothetical protein
MLGQLPLAKIHDAIRLLYVERTTFNRILGSIEDILRRNQSY